MNEQQQELNERIADDERHAATMRKARDYDALAALVALGAIGGLMQARADSDDWPVTCDVAGCVPATVTPVVWEAGRQ